MKLRVRAVAAGLLAAGMLLAGCATPSNDESPTPGGEGSEEPGRLEEGMVGRPDSGDPVSGGTLSFSGNSQPLSLDPAKIVASGTTGGTEMAAIYDTLLRYDAETKEFVPQLAEGIEPNDDLTEWTLTLREGVQFSDGQVLDAAAVKASQERYRDLKGPESALWIDNDVTVTVENPTTVVYTLKRPWGTFPAILSSGPGMIVTPDAGADDAFKPIGAGPFTLEKFAPQEEIVMMANPNYWDGAPHLKQLRFVFMPDENARADALKGKSIDLMIMRSPVITDEMLDSGRGGYLSMTAAGYINLINGGEGRPGHDQRVRKALALAIDPKVISERVFEGRGIFETTLFPSYSAGTRPPKAWSPTSRRPERCSIRPRPTGTTARS